MGTDRHAPRSIYQVGDRIRYLPGVGTYGYKDAAGQDGRVDGRVIGHTPTRVRVQLSMGGYLKVTAVDEDSLVRAD